MHELYLLFFEIDRGLVLAPQNFFHLIQSHLFLAKLGPQLLNL